MNQWCLKANVAARPAIQWEWSPLWFTLFSDGLLMNMATTEADSSCCLPQKCQTGMSSVAVARQVLSGPLFRYVNFPPCFEQTLLEKCFYKYCSTFLVLIGSLAQAPLPSVFGHWVRGTMRHGYFRNAAKPYNTYACVDSGCPQAHPTAWSFCNVLNLLALRTVLRPLARDPWVQSPSLTHVLHFGLFQTSLCLSSSDSTTLWDCHWVLSSRNEYTSDFETKQQVCLCQPMGTQRI